ncbi:integral membrane protein [Haloferula luteola]|uniref:Integral membrane protein n=1 Tax=Haloferula luteola TaxID=595692 RepID=A0A840VHD8_9BACT|nr:DUF3817 domain-containing protein [Haloferula luteola]MBB5352171.1 integral membrane protein [Haloferula luteola]
MSHASLKDPIGRIRWVGRIEAVSFLFLLGVAMPMKYLADQEIWVKVTGMAHGVLFLLLLLLVGIAWLEKCIPLKTAAMVMGASLLPFGPFVVDSRLAKRETDAG